MWPCKPSMRWKFAFFFIKEPDNDSIKCVGIMISVGLAKP